MKKIFALIIFLIILSNSIFYTVDESEFVVITEFGNPIKTIEEAGLYFKKPSPLQTISRFSKRLFVFDPPPNELLTLDKKNILIDSFILWKIDSPILFLETVKNIEGANNSLSDILFSQLGAALGNQPLSILFSTVKGKMKVEELLDSVSKNSNEIALKDYGINVVDVHIKRQNFPEQNRSSVFSRMRSERERIAKKYRSEGQEEALKIEAQTKKEERIILSKAYRKSQEIRGETDAKVIEIYAKAYKSDPKFYKFLRTLEAYQKILDDKTTIILPADSELLKLLYKGPNK